MNEEKDRFGEFIRLLEKAREDVYFAEKDRELLENLKRHLASAGSLTVQGNALRCPRCNLVLGDASLMSVPIHPCPDCGGIWIERGSVPQLLKARTEPAGGP